MFLARHVELLTRKGDPLYQLFRLTLREQERIDEFLSDPDNQEAIIDWSYGMVGGGVPAAVHLAFALAEGDMDEIIYRAKIELAVLVAQYGILQALNSIQGPKYAMRFHKVHASMGAARGLILRALWPLAPVAAAYASSEIGESIAELHPGTNAESTVAVQWSQTGNTGGGGVMPVIPSDGGSSDTWFPELREWWDDL